MIDATQGADSAVADLFDAEEQAQLAAGFSGDSKPTAKPPAPEPKPAATPLAEVKPAPKHVRLTADQYAELTTSRTSLEKQMSTAFGTMGQMQKVINELKAETPRGARVAMPKDAFAEMAKDFPELAAHLQTSVERALSGATGTGPGNAEVDDGKVQAALAKLVSAREIENLTDAYPDWRTIVGAVDASKQQHDSNNPYRKWLATQDPAYQARINGTESAVVIERSIRRFRSETKAPAPSAQSPRADARAQRIAAAVQPRGDGAAPSSGPSDEEQFAAGFASR